jgi:hypothetical protein
MLGTNGASRPSQTMTSGARIIAIATAVGALVAATGALAQSARAPFNFGVESISNFNSGPEQDRWLAQPSEKSLFWDQKGHWGLKLDLSQPVGRDMQLGDIQAGAYFHLTPSIRVGGAVALGDSSALDRTVAPQQQSQTPRVKLETSFKFCPGAPLDPAKSAAQPSRALRAHPPPRSPRPLRTAAVWPSAH